MVQLLPIFVNVITPVFALVVFGYIAKPRLQLQAATLSRYAYYLLIPAFVFQTISRSTVDSTALARMVGFIVAVTLACGLLGFVAALALRRSRKMIAAYVMVAVFANVGNFGLPIIQFHLGAAALVPATIYFLVIMVLGFVIGVGAASMASGRGSVATALADVAKTPALIALVPAILVNITGWQPPLVVDRIVGLLAVAMVPTMLVALGAQLADTKQVRFTGDVVLASTVRLAGGPLLALLLAPLFGLAGMDYRAGVFQLAMPAAVLIAIIAMEYDVEKDFVTTTVLFSTLASVLTLTVLLAVV